MKNFVDESKKWLSGFLVVILLTAGCTLLDPTNTVNLETTADDLASAADGATQTFVNALEPLVTEMVEWNAWYAAGMTDEFATQADEYPTSTDAPDRHTFINDIGYQNVHNLRALADNVIDVTIPNDNLATDELKGLAYFSRGIAFLVSAENYRMMPIAPDTAPLTWAARLNLAISDLETARPLNEDLETVIYILLARAYRLKGDDLQARSEAEGAIASGAEDYVYFCLFDPNGSLASENDLWDVATGTVTHDVQPLPRLDFLDAKYLEFDQSIPLAKMEEAHLILAEIALADGDNDGAKTHLSEAVRIANDRPREETDDIDNRSQWFDRGGAVPSADVLVKADDESPALPGLVLPRYGATIMVPTVSGSSLDDTALLALPTATTADLEELLRLIYLSRQEIFFFEGRRVADLGIRRQMSREEWEQNDLISNGDEGTDGDIFLPSFIPADDGLDRWSIDGLVVTIEWDMNKVLAENRNGSAPVLGGLPTTLPFTFPF